MKFRPLTEEDVVLARRIVESQPRSAAFFWPENLLSSEFRLCRTLGCFVESELQGFALWREGEQAEIICVAIHPLRQGQGLGSRLLMEVFQAQPDASWHLEVHEENQVARRLYEGLGFRLDRLRTGYYRDGGNALCLSRSPWSDKPLL